MRSLTIVSPCFNEVAVLPNTIEQLTSALLDLQGKNKVCSSSRLLFIDDGSTDGTWDLIKHYRESGYPVEGIKLSRNRGHQNALIAGLLMAQGDVIISIDADLQDDISTLEKMLDENSMGSEIVYGIRNQRSSDSWFKRTSAQLFYRIMLAFGADIIYNHADYRLMSRRAIDALREFREVNLFLRGLLPMLGFKYSVVTYSRYPRAAGTSKYPLRKMLSLSINAITSLSVVPLRVISLFGVLISFLSIILALWVFVVAISTSSTVAGWASTLLPIFFLGGIQLLSLGIIGEYIGRIYMESKQRPRYIIDSLLQGKEPL